MPDYDEIAAALTDGLPAIWSSFDDAYAAEKTIARALREAHERGREETSTYGRDRANADYIARACNAYPRLVAAIRELCDPTVTSTLDGQAAICDALALLTELGETEE